MTFPDVRALAGHGRAQRIWKNELLQPVFDGSTVFQPDDHFIVHCPDFHFVKQRTAFYPRQTRAARH